MVEHGKTPNSFARGSLIKQLRSSRVGFDCQIQLRTACCLDVDVHMLDRIDIHMEVPRVDYEKLKGDRFEWSVFDAAGDESVEFISTCLSSHREA